MTRTLIRPAAPRDLEEWTALRAELWPDEDVADHRAEVAETLGSGKDTCRQIL